MNRLTRVGLLAIASLFGIVGNIGIAQDSPFKVVVNAANQNSSISRQTLSRIFLKKITNWEDRQEVIPVDLPAHSDTRAHFSRMVLGRDVRSVKSYWHTMIFSGRMSPPTEVKSDSEVLEYLRTHPSAIGYVARTTSIPNHVKVRSLAAHALLLLRVARLALQPCWIFTILPEVYTSCSAPESR